MYTVRAVCLSTACLKHLLCLRKSERLNKKQAKCVGRAEEQSLDADVN